MFLRFFANIIEKVFLLSGGLFFSQVPTIMQKYQDVLYGRYLEAQRMLQKVQHVAKSGHMDMEQMLSHLCHSADSVVSQHGKMLQEWLLRRNDLQRQWEYWQHTKPFLRPIAFLKEGDFSLFEEVWKRFQPSMSFSVQELGYFAIGALIGAALFRVLLGALRLIAAASCRL